MPETILVYHETSGMVFEMLDGDPVFDESLLQVVRDWFTVGGVCENGSG